MYYVRRRAYGIICKVSDVTHGAFTRENALIFIDKCTQNDKKYILESPFYRRVTYKLIEKTI